MTRNVRETQSKNVLVHPTLLQFYTVLIVCELMLIVVFLLAGARAPLTAAERVRRYRERLKKNPEKVEETKKKRHEYYMKNRTLVANQSKQEQRKMREQWRIQQQNRRQKQVALKNAAPKAQKPNGNPKIDDGDDQSGASH